MIIIYAHILIAVLNPAGGVRERNGGIGFEFVGAVGDTEMQS